MTVAQTSRRTAFGLGSNVGDRLAYLQGAVDRIAVEPSVRLFGVSKIYVTAPIGGPEQGDFLNAVVVVDTTLAPKELLRLAQRCEEEAGRERLEHWGPRTLDVDVLAVGDIELDDSSLTLPHPRATERAFVLRPWADVDPLFVVAGGMTVGELLEQVDGSGVRASAERLTVAA